MKRILPCILALVFLLACVPTPDEEAVISRADGALEKAVLAKPVEPYSYEAPSRWDETFFAGKQEVHTSADIETPDATKYPVVTIKQRTLTPSDLLQFLTLFSPGDWSVRENEYSREELTVDLKNASKGVLVGADDDIHWEPDEEAMQRIQGLIEQAPLEDTYVPLTEKNMPDVRQHRRLKDSAGELWYTLRSSDRFSLHRYRDGNIQPEAWVLEGDATPDEPPHALENIKITEDEAIAVGDALMEKLGKTDFHAAEAQRAREIQSYSYESYGEGYLLFYVQTLEGASPCFYSTYRDPDFMPFLYSGGQTYAPDWRQEYFELFVTENGVSSIAWFAPKETVMVANENVQLMPFDQVQKNVKKLIEYCTGAYDGEPILITRVVLTSVIAKIADQGEEAFLVPAWAIFMTTEFDQMQHVEDSVLLINAIDGTYISRGTGDDGLPEVGSPTERDAQ